MIGFAARDWPPAGKPISEDAMPEPSTMILYVAEKTVSRAFYADLLDRQPVEESPKFAGFALDSGLILGVWSRDVVQPPAPAAGMSGEIVFPVADNAAVDAAYADWRKRGLKIEQEPKDAEFGRNFVALDPDGHRLRVLAMPAS